MPALTPKLSASIAKSVYELVNFASPNEGLGFIANDFGQIMKLDEQSLISAKTGGPLIIKSRTAFGLCVFGKGIYRGHAFLIFRGTKFLADWLTNLNVGTSRSSSGHAVHDGFKQAYKSMTHQLTPFFASFGQHGVHTVHCIGHSLGGAVATLCADDLVGKTGRKPYLYTFGAPRVGLQPFADYLSSKLLPSRLFRVYHSSDIVPCIPFWPFVHAPSLLAHSYDYYQPTPGDFPGGEWHDMGLYVKTVGSAKWSALRGRRLQQMNQGSIESWLRKTGPLQFSPTNLEWLDNAMNYVLSKVLNGVGSIATMVASGCLTLMDRVAYLLKEGIKQSAALSALVYRLIKRIMSLLGLKPLVEGVDASQNFIRSVLKQLMHRMQTYCKQVMDRALVGGRGM